MEKKAKKCVNNAASMNNGIIMFSNRNPFIAVETCYNENEEIESRIITGSKAQKHENINNDPIVVDRKLRDMLNIVIFLLSIIATISTKNVSFIVAAIVFILRKGISYIITFCIMVKEYKLKNGSKYELAKFHSAEHKVIDAYEKLGRIPTYSEVKKASRLSRDCGSLLIINELFYQIFCPITLILGGNFFINTNIFSTEIFINKEIWTKGLILSGFIIAIGLIYYLIVYLVIKCAILRFMEIFFTNKPTKREIELSLVAIENFEKLEKSINQIYKEHNIVFSSDIKEGHL